MIDHKVLGSASGPFCDLKTPKLPLVMRLGCACFEKSSTSRHPDGPAVVPAARRAHNRVRRLRTSSVAAILKEPTDERNVLFLREQDVTVGRAAAAHQGTTQTTPRPVTTQQAGRPWNLKRLHGEQLPRRLYGGRVSTGARGVSWSAFAIMMVNDQILLHPCGSVFSAQLSRRGKAHTVKGGHGDH